MRINTAVGSMAGRLRGARRWCQDISLQFGSCSERDWLGGVILCGRDTLMLKVQFGSSGVVYCGRVDVLTYITRRLSWSVVGSVSLGKQYIQVFF